MNHDQLMERIQARWAGEEVQRQRQREVAQLLQRNNWRSFPGAQPVSFARSHFEELKKHDYYVCEKTDGQRYLMYLAKGVDDSGQPVSYQYLIDRKNNYYYVENPPFPNPDKRPEEFHIDTILDGELVEDREVSGSVIKYLVFDMLFYNGKDFRPRPLDKRLGYLKSFILRPYNDMLRENPDWKRDLFFEVKDKDTEFAYALQKMFFETIPKVKKVHGNDGLIFTCRETPYSSGTDQHIIKWKSPEENTVDFLMHIRWAEADPDPDDLNQTVYEDYDAFPADVGLYIYHGNQADYARVGNLFLTPDDWVRMKGEGKPLQDCIVECYLEDTSTLNGHTINGNTHDTKRWRFHRFREDKEEANHVSTFESVRASIEDHVTEKELLDRAEEIRAAWKKRREREEEAKRNKSISH
ncbi:Dcp1p-Dcp2p decapping enzyme complex alpha subunit [Neophaeococcomyces mojaviensis]|uniref:Dcp1p-Dcp2p decapping enzyme complex alpha subunit n=1 Tax=Neophaeococcomyces mojaviensis TaxID=3383035 RepID=A0ACC3A8H1_9EURO|nr:Dcp1p-Dcp2p decapping enzyme complex alpha subunit [Knufia sp. JES_112]